MTASPTPAATPEAAALRREVRRVRRRARAVLLAGAAVAALAADAWYEVGSFWIFRLLQVRIWNPIFVLVAFAVLAALAARRTRALALCGLLDTRFALKNRLVSALRFARHPQVPPDLREAQARETLRAVDFSRLRASFRFRPWGPLAWLAAGCGIVGALMYRYPDSFNPRSLAFRQGRVVFRAVKQLAEGSRSGSGAPGADESSGEGGNHPLVALVPERPTPAQERAPDPQPAGGTGEKPPPRHDEDRGREPQQTSGRQPETRAADRPPPGQGSRPGPNEGGALGRGASLEETDGISPPTARPEKGLASPAADLRVPGAGASLPPLPFVRLFGGGTQASALFDPEALNIVIEAYPRKYREHLEAYLKALQALERGRKDL